MRAPLAIRARWACGWTRVIPTIAATTRASATRSAAAAGPVRSTSGSCSDQRRSLAGTRGQLAAGLPDDVAQPVVCGIVVGALVPDEGAGDRGERNRRRVPREGRPVAVQPEQERGNGRNEVASRHEPRDRKERWHHEGGTPRAGAGFERPVDLGVHAAGPGEDDVAEPAEPLEAESLSDLGMAGANDRDVGSREDHLRAEARPWLGRDGQREVDGPVGEPFLRHAPSAWTGAQVHARGLSLQAFREEGKQAHLPGVLQRERERAMALARVERAWGREGLLDLLQGAVYGQDQVARPSRRRHSVGRANQDGGVEQRARPAERVARGRLREPDPPPRPPSP